MFNRCHHLPSVLPAAGIEPSGASDCLASILKRTSKQHRFSLEQASVSQTRVILSWLPIYPFKFLRQYSQEPLSTRSSKSKILVVSFWTIPPLQFKTCESDTHPPALGDPSSGGGGGRVDSFSTCDTWSEASLAHEWFSKGRHGPADPGCLKHGYQTMPQTCSYNKPPTPSD